MSLAARQRAKWRLANLKFEPPRGRPQGARECARRRRQLAEGKLEFKAWSLRP
jgi:hypothetical protein